jgi:FtsH-binding integral membrane protein
LLALDGLVFGTGVTDVALVITSSEDALLTEAEHPTTVRTVAIDIVVNFFIWRPCLSVIFSSGVVAVWVLPYAKQNSTYIYSKG